MVRVEVTRRALDAAVARDAGDWKEWSELKPVFLDLQHHKCAYCESEIGGRPAPKTGRRDRHHQDVEHYRPKKSLKHWSIPESWSSKPSPVVDGRKEGYPWLELDLSNYVASCRACNVTHKASYFPVQRLLDDYDDQPSAEQLKTEGPYLIFPFGDLEAIGPQDLIMFVGAEAFPHFQWSNDSNEYWRARVTIELLGLNRQDLVIPRQKLIAELALLLSVRPGGDAGKWGQILRKRCGNDQTFSSCATYFANLHLKKPQIAVRLARGILRQLGREEEAELLA